MIKISNFLIKQPYPVEKVVPRIVYKDRQVPQPYPVEKIVTVEKPVEKIVEQIQYVDRPVPQPYPVEKIVEQIIQKPVEKIVYKNREVPQVSFPTKYTLTLNICKYIYFFQ